VCNNGTKHSEVNIPHVICSPSCVHGTTVNVASLAFVQIESFYVKCGSLCLYARISQKASTTKCSIFLEITSTAECTNNYKYGISLL
jgi:hypothetical protein